MEIEKAIEDLKGLNERSSKESDLFKERHGKNFDIAIQALEKQIGKKPEIINYGTNICAECQCDLLRCESYCPECGQKIDWGDE